MYIPEGSISVMENKAIGMTRCWNVFIKEGNLIKRVIRASVPFRVPQGVYKTLKYFPRDSNNKFYHGIPIVVNKTFNV